MIYLIRPTLEFVRDLRIQKGITMKPTDYQLFSPDNYIVGQFRSNEGRFILLEDRLRVDNSKELLAHYLHELGTQRIDVVAQGDCSAAPLLEIIVDFFIQVPRHRQNNHKFIQVCYGIVQELCSERY